MRAYYLKNMGKKPLIMYSKKSWPYNLVSGEMVKKEVSGEFIAHGLKKAKLAVPFRKYATVRNCSIDDLSVIETLIPSIGAIVGNCSVADCKHGEIYTFLELLRLPKIERKGLKIYRIKKLDDLASLCPDKVE